jgi:NADH:ubiquinone oxidoreductase subunit K
MAIAAAEATVGLALVIAIIRTRQTAEVDEYDDLKE